ncbi:putative WW domain, SET domain, Post-SET domain, AWS domain, Set2 Rpb1 interacting [Septoria linicola]|nr:putative WW domain, SET domain, Post-SET domain, AWS domain, Set2 Rpb1 interacting [Septoria linicola]
MATNEQKHGRLESEVREMHLKEEEDDLDMDTIPVSAGAAKEVTSGTTSGNGTPPGVQRQSRSPVKQKFDAESPAIKSDDEETVGGDVTLKMEPGKPPKLLRTTSHKIEKRSPRLFFDHEDSTDESKGTFEVLPQCTYANKHLGTTEHALECDCAEEWDPATRTNHACGEDTDCINRATKMECVGDCGCGSGCQNRRFEHKQYADVSVIKTEKKGYGLRANTELRANDFIFEYIGEVIGDQVFRRRLHQYDEEGIKHFYFMSLSKGEFVDATKKGNLGRFCNHSCNPNCYVDKWVVGDKLRMGIFAERKIQAGEELVFNYNVDRYGADPQPCYCDEPNCTGFIGGKTQTERATKLSSTIIEALGIDDADAWDTAVARRPRRKKAGEDDEEYVNNVEPRGLDEEGVNKVMSSLMQCKEKWIAVKLLTRIQRATDDKVRHRVVRFHGYRILKTALANFEGDVNVCIQILDILDTMPRLTRNKIQDSKIEEAIGPLVEHEDERVVFRAKELMEAWSKLEVAYRIPRMKRDPNAILPDRKADRRDGERRRSKSRSRSKSPERIVAPTGPRAGAPARGGFARPPPRFRPPPPGNALPFGWFEATAANGATYYYTQTGTTTWQRPTVPANAAPPPPPPKAVTDQMLLQDLIKNIVASKQETPAKPSATPTPVETPKKERKQEKWRTLPEEKQKKLYENAIQPNILHVASKFKKELARDDLKRWSKEFAKQIVESDFRKGRVEDPNKVSDKRAKDIKKQCQAFFEKAKKKKAVADQKRAERKAVKEKDGDGSRTPLGSPPTATLSPDVVDHDILSDHDMDDTLDGTPQESTTASKRRRDDLASLTDEALTAKKQRTESVDFAPPPPPPPPPAGDVIPEMQHVVSAHVESYPNGSSGLDQDLGFSIKGAARSQSRPESRSDEPRQTATPPTTGSPDQDDTETTLKRSSYGTMDPGRMRQLGLLDGASE